MATVETSVENESPEMIVIDLRKKEAEPIEDVIKRYENYRVMISSPSLKKYESYRLGLDSEKNRKPLYDGTILRPTDFGFVFRLFDEYNSRVFINNRDLRRILVIERKKRIPIKMICYIN